MNNTLTTRDREKVAYHYNLPITIFKDPNFSEQVDLFEEHYRTKSIYDKVAPFFGAYQNLIDRTKELSLKIINDIANSKEFNDFSNYMDVDEVFGKEFPKGDKSYHKLYNEHFVGKRIVSFDLVKANFQSMRLSHPSIFNQHRSFDDYLKEKLTALDKDYPAEYMIGAKMIRQIIFGKLNPQKQISILKRLTGGLSYNITRLHGNDLKLESFSHDELQFVIAKDVSNETIRTYFKALVDCELDYRLEFFTVEESGTEKFKFYSKRDLETGKVVPKQVSSHLLYEVICFMKGIEPKQNMKEFEFEGRRCQFIDSLF